MIMKRNERGFSLIEVLIVSAVSAVVLAAVFTVIVSSVRQDEVLRTQMEMQIEAARSMREITSLMKAAGPIDINRNGSFDALSDYPAFATDAIVFDADVIAGSQTVQPGQFPPSPFGSLSGLNTFLSSPRKLTRAVAQDAPENGASNEIAFRLPEDRNNDGNLTDASGNIEWSQDVYVICHEARSPVEWIETGNVLMLRRFRETPVNSGVWTEILAAPTLDAGGNTVPPIGRGRQILANWVERVLIETRDPQFYQSGNYDTSLGQDQMRITIWFRRQDVSQRQERQVFAQQSTTVIFRSIDR